MKTLLNSLTIGEKIGISFGFVGLLFLVVIWQYHNTLENALTDYRKLQDVFETKKAIADDIEHALLQAGLAERDFLIHRDMHFVEQVDENTATILKRALDLKNIDAPASQTARSIGTQIEIYRQRFETIVQAWRIKGLDHNSGLQGAFRNTVHALESLAEHFKVEDLYLQLLQIRRAEKDMALKRGSEYRDKTLQLLRVFINKSENSAISSALKAQLQQESEIYREAFEVYAAQLLTQGELEDIDAPFRESARRMESMLSAHFIPDLSRDILQLRRREKDYLLRDDKRYVTMALQELQGMRNQIEASSISADDKLRLLGLLANYEKDFLALVEQNDRIVRLDAEMQEAISRIFPLVENNVEQATRIRDEMTTKVNTTSRSRARVMLWIVSIAILLGIFFTLAITRGIARRLHLIADLVGKLAYEAPAERIATIPGGRDEINAMAKSVNAMADHKGRFMSWWDASMQETEAYRKMRESSDDLDREADAETMTQVRKTKAEALTSMHRDIRDHASRIIESARQAQLAYASTHRRARLKSIEEKGRAITAIIDIVSARQKP
jgi:methyl-accepting chemotaxis protein